MQNKGHYKNGKIISQKDGDILTYFYKSGKIKAKGMFIGDKMEGEWRFYRENGQLIQIGNFAANEKHGSWTRFDTEDNIEYHEIFEYGKKIKKNQ